MRSVRCDACGSKALIAASQCPSCGHLFEVRDGFGDLLPLAHCPTCDTFYPERVGSCRWCGTTPPPRSSHPGLWRHVGVAALVVVGVGLGAVAMHTAKSRIRHVARVGAPSNPVLQTVPVAVATPAPSTDAVVAVAPTTAADSVAPPVVAVADSIAPPPVVAPAVVAAPVARAPVAVVTKASVSVHWISSIATRWVIVRADARRDARIVASVGPDSRVQLGESRGSWRRIRARGIAGWVEPRAAFAAPRSSAKTRGLAAR